MNFAILLKVWWRSVRNDHAWSGVRIWVDMLRDIKAAQMREKRRERDYATVRRQYRGRPSSSAPHDQLNSDLSGLQNAYGTYGHHSQAAWANTYHPLQAAAQSSLQQYGNHGVSNSFLHMMGMR
jgi:hypothetical protein